MKGAGRKFIAAGRAGSDRIIRCIQPQAARSHGLSIMPVNDRRSFDSRKTALVPERRRDPAITSD